MSKLSDIRMKIAVSVNGLASIQALNTALNGISGATASASAATSAAAKTTSSAAQTTQKYAGALQQQSTQQGNAYLAGFALLRVGSQLNEMGEKGIKVLQDSLNSWGDYEFALNRAAGALNVWDKANTGGRIGTDALSKAVHDAAQETRLFPAEDVARGVYYWGSTTGQVVETQKDLKTTLAGVIPIMKAAAITETGYESAIKGVYSILVQYHLPLEKATDVTEKLMLATQKTALEFPDLINSFKFIGPMASAMGVSFDDVATILGRLGDAGIRGTMAGRALSMTFTRLVKPTEDGKAALDELFLSTKGLGKSFDDIVFPNGEFAGMETLLNSLSVATEGLTQREKFNLLGRIATQNELRVLVPLIDQQTKLRHQSADAIDLEKYSLDNAHKSFEKTFDLLKNSWQGVSGAVQRSIEPIIHLVGETLAEALTYVADKARVFLDWLRAILEQNPKLLQFVVAVVAVGSAMLAIVGTLATIGGSVLLISHALEGLGLTLGGLMAPFAAIFIAVAAGVAIWQTNFMGIRDLVTKTIGNFIRMVEGFVKSILGAGSDFKWLGGIIQVAAEIAGSALKLLLNIVNGIFSFFADNEPVLKFAVALGGITIAALGVAKAIGLVNVAMALIAANPIVAAIIAIVTAVVLLYTAWENNWLGMRDIITNVFATIADIVGNIVGTVIGAAKEVVKVAASIPGPWQQGAQELAQTLDEMENDVKNWGNDVRGAAGQTNDQLVQMTLDYNTRQHTATSYGLEQTARLEKDNHQMRVTDKAGTIKEMEYMDQQHWQWQIAQETVAQATITAAAKAGGEVHKTTTQSTLKDIDSYYKNLRAQMVENSRLGMEGVHYQFTAQAPDIKKKAKELSDGVVDEMETMKGDSITKTTEMVTSIADTIQNARDEVDNAGKALKDAMSHQMTEMQEIAKLKGILTGDELAKGLKSKDPVVRARAEELKLTVEQRLTDLQGDTKTYGKKTGDAYATGLKNSKGNIQGAIDYIISPLIQYMKAFSPPKYGPLRQIDDWGANLGQTWADSIGSQGDYVQRVAAGLANKAKDGLQTYDLAAAAGLSGSGSLSISSRNDQNRTLRVEVVSPDGSVSQLDAKTIAGLLRPDAMDMLEHTASLGA